MPRSRHPRGRPQDRVAVTRNPSRPSPAATGQGTTSRKPNPSAQTILSYQQSATTLLKQYQGTLSKLAQSEALISGNLTRVFRAISEACCSLLQVKRATIWLPAKERNSIELMDLCISGLKHSNPTFVVPPSHWPAYLRSLTRPPSRHCDPPFCSRSTIQGCRLLVPVSIPYQGRAQRADQAEWKARGRALCRVGRCTSAVDSA